MKKKQYLVGEIKSPQTGEIFSGIASDGKQDRDGDTINPNGWMLDDYKKNPILLWGHNPYQPPVGKTFNQRIEGGQLRFDFMFANTASAQELKELVRDGFLNTFSVGFIPLDMGDTEKGEYTFTRSELLEISLVAIPSNTDAMVTSRAFKACSEETKRYIMGEIKRAKTIVDHESTTFPEAKEYKWDEEAERRGADIDALKAMATYIDDSAPNDKASYKLLHHTSGKEYPLVKDALDVAMKSIDELPEEVRDDAYAHLKGHYEALGFETPEKPAKQVEQGEEKDVKVELADEDRTLLKRVADALEKASQGEVAEHLEAKIKVDRVERDEDRSKAIMIRALQLTAKTISKRLHELKTT